MANIEPGNYYLHRTFAYSGNQMAVNTRYLTITSLTGAPPSESAFVNALDATLAAVYKQALANVAQYIGSDIQNITAVKPYPSQVGATANTGNGTGGTTPMPGQVAGLVSTYTALSGRNYRGRAYIPFPPTAAGTTTTPSAPTTAYQTILNSIGALTSGGQSLTVTGTIVNFSWVIRHSSPPAIKDGYTTTTSYLGKPSWATQKKRGDYGRTNAIPVP